AQLTVVAPTGKVPGSWEHVTGTAPSTSSVAVAVQLTVAPDGPVASVVIADGSVRTGGSVSGAGVTVTPKEASPVLPASSVARQVTSVVPTGNVPGGGSQVTSTEASTASSAVADH